MNKKLLAFAVAAAFAAPMVANADSGNVTIYGIAHASVDRANPGSNTTGAAGGFNDTAWRVSSNSSRLGFKGTEDLGNGLSAVWQMETAVGMDSGSTATGFMTRNTFVGLSSKTAGTGILGRHDTPYKLGTAKLDIFADTMGDYNAVIGAAMACGNAACTTSTAGTLFDSRLGNVIAYISPTWSGFHAAAAAVMANESNNSATRDGKAYSLTGVYDNGPLFASLSYEQAKDISAASTDVVAATGGTAVLANTLGAVNKAEGTKLGLGYKMGAAGVGFIWEKIKGDSDSRNAWYLNGSYAMGSNVLKAAYGRIGNWSGVSDATGRQLTVGVDHNFSKRTTVYALYSKMNNDTNAAYGLGGNGAGGAFAPATAGEDPSVISLGMKHSF